MPRVKPESVFDADYFGPSRTKQAFADAVNINKIVARYKKTGMLNHVNGKTPFYGDVSEFVDYKQAVDMVAEANALFAGMSAQIRERFGNDPAQMIAFLENPANLEEARSLGMVAPLPVEPPVTPNPPAPASTPV